MTGLAALALMTVPAAAITATEIRDRAIPLSDPSRLPDELFAPIEAYAVIAVGELHGTEEAPAFAGGLVELLQRHGRSPLLALEMPETEQAVVDGYLADGDSARLTRSAFFRVARENQDGRRSRAIAKLLKRARSLGVPVLCFDPASSRDAQARDTGMAARLYAGSRRGGAQAVVALVGNVHASGGLGSPWEPSFRPMGYELTHGAGLEPRQLLSILARYKGGSAWTCQSDGCGVHPAGARLDDPFSDASLPAAYFVTHAVQPFDPGAGYGATFFSRTIHASLPLTEAVK